MRTINSTKKKNFFLNLNQLITINKTLFRYWFRSPYNLIFAIIVPGWIISKQLIIFFLNPSSVIGAQNLIIECAQGITYSIVATGVISAGGMFHQLSNSILFSRIKVSSIRFSTAILTLCLFHLSIQLILPSLFFFPLTIWVSIIFSTRINFFLLLICLIMTSLISTMIGILISFISTDIRVTGITLGIILFALLWSNGQFYYLTETMKEHSYFLLSLLSPLVYVSDLEFFSLVGLSKLSFFLGRNTQLKELIIASASLFSILFLNVRLLKRKEISL